MVSPNKYTFDQRSEKVVDILVSNKLVEIIADGDNGTKLVDVGGALCRMHRSCLMKKLPSLPRMANIAENHYGIPQDVEWGIVNGTIYILQSRPITTIGNKKEAKQMSGQQQSATIILRGQGASPGVASVR